jgi:hypothetical protein
LRLKRAYLLEHVAVDFDLSIGLGLLLNAVIGRGLRGRNSHRNGDFGVRVFEEKISGRLHELGVEFLCLQES